MSVFQSLTKEHRLFDRLIGRFERCLKYEEQAARRELRETLLVLAPALDRHEELEHLLFDHPAYAAQKGARRLLAVVEAQHKKIETLRKDVGSLLSDSNHYEFMRLKSLALLLVERLRLHFETEETLLWPHYNGVDSRSLRRSLDRRTEERVKAMEQEMKKYWRVISDYLVGRP